MFRRVSVVTTVLLMALFSGPAVAQTQSGAIRIVEAEVVDSELAVNLSNPVFVYGNGTCGAPGDAVIRTKVTDLETGGQAEGSEQVRCMRAGESIRWSVGNSTLQLAKIRPGDRALVEATAAGTLAIPTDPNNTGPAIEDSDTKQLVLKWKT